jgi:hypothetical protein
LSTEFLYTAKIKNANKHTLFDEFEKTVQRKYRGKLVATNRGIAEVGNHTIL